MAVYKGREVTVLGKSDGEDTSPLYTIMERDGQRSNVPMNQIQFTKEELKDQEKGAAWHLDGARVIEDKDLQALRDSQDKAKLEKQPTPDKDIEVSKMKVPAEELKKAK
jgi:hypothetical protein